VKYPSLEEVDKADLRQLAEWYRHLPVGSTSEHLNVINRVVDRFFDLGGWTPELSKQVGWGKR
jgi:hypothetical protein